MKGSKNAYKRYFKQWNWTKNRTRIATPTMEAPDEIGGRFLTSLSSFIMNSADVLVRPCSIICNNVDSCNSKQSAQPAFRRSSKEQTLLSFPRAP
jgi:hypothetical protein